MTIENPPKPSSYRAIINTYSSQASQLFTQYERVSFEQIHGHWEHLLPSTPSLVLDIGAGSGRDAAYLASCGHEVVAVEPANELREMAQAEHPSPRIRWLDDTLPDIRQVERLRIKFDFILLSAVWMHVHPNERSRVLRKLAALLRPGGLLVMTLRVGPPPLDRPMHPASAEDVERLARQQMLMVTLRHKESDVQGRPDVCWETLVLQLPDDGSQSLPLLRHVIINDAKASTYKLALIRSIVRIADGSAGAVLHRNKEHAAVPLGLVALYWLRLYKPLIARGYLQKPSDRRGAGLAFVREAFYQLAPVPPVELRPGATFTGDRARALNTALYDAARVITQMPAHYITSPGGTAQVFTATRSQRRQRQPDQVVLNREYLSNFGELKVPLPLWESMQRHACWIEPALNHEWARLMQNYDGQNAKRLDDYLEALAWFDVTDVRRTQDARRAAESLVQGGKSLYCVWSGKRLRIHSYAIDHCLPFAYWPNNDLWNLLPSHPTINSRKSDKLPTPDKLSEARQRILEWWDSAYGHDALRNRFFSEASASLPGVTSDQQLSTEAIYTALEMQRIILRRDQQIAEWPS